MKKRNSFYFIAVVIATNPIIDMIYSIFGDTKIWLFSLNQLIRIVLLVLTVLFLKTARSRKQTLWLSLFLFLIIGIQKLNGVTGSLVSDIGFILKIIFGFAFLRLVLDEQEHNPNFYIDIRKAINISTLIIFANIILGIFGFGSQTYTETSSRVNGYLGYLSGNLVTANSLLIIFAYYLYMSVAYKKRQDILFSIVVFVSLFLLASKFSIFGSLVLLLIVFIVYEKNANSQTRSKLLFGGFVLLIMSLFVLIPYSVKYIRGIVSEAQRYDYDFFTALTTNRFMQIDLIKKYGISLTTSNIHLIRLFGFSYSNTNQILNTAKADFMAIELDFHGLYYYLGGIFAFAVIVYFLRLLKKGFIVFKKKDIKGEISYLTVCLLLVGALLGGHVLYEMTTLVYFAIPCGTVMSFYSRRRVVVIKQQV